jgi:hypothetical protein
MASPYPSSSPSGVTFVVGEATSFTAFFVGQALISGHAPHAALGDPGVARAVAGAGLALTALAVLSVAAGALLRHPAAAIGSLIAVLFVLPGIAQALPDSWRNPVTEFWPTQAGGQLTSVHHSAHTLQPWPGCHDVPVRRHRVRHRLDAAGPPGRMTAVRARRHTQDPDPRGAGRHLSRRAGHPGRAGGLWLRRTLVLVRFHAVVVPSGWSTSVQPQR